MKFFNKIKSLIIKIKDNLFTPKIITLKEEDILNSLKYNMIFNKREYIINSTGVIYDTFMCFNYLEDMKEFYEIKNKELRIYIDKYDKLKQLVINIALYLGTIDKERLIFDEEKYILYTNILSFMEEAERFNRNFDIEKFFSKQSWIKKCEKIGNNKSFKIEIDNREFIQYSYKIIYSSKEEIIGKNEKEYAKIDLKNKKILFGLKI